MTVVIDPVPTAPSERPRRQPARRPRLRVAKPPARTQLERRFAVWIRKRQALPPRPPLEPWRKTAAVSLLTLCALLLWAFMYVLVFSTVQHSRSQYELYATFRSQLAQATAPTGPVSSGTAVALLSIPSAGLASEVVVEGTTSDVMRSGPGHLRTSPLPGQPGTSYIFGRALSFGGPFAHIASLRTGDAITATTDQGVFQYGVTDVRHAGDPLPAPLAASAGRLTLVSTSGGWTPSDVVYVDALLHGAAAPFAGGLPNTLVSTEKPMAGDTDALTYCEIVLWVQLLVVVTCVIPYLRHRWGIWQIWLVGLPVLLAVTWGASSTAVRLLPNLF